MGSFHTAHRQAARTGSTAAKMISSKTFTPDRRESRLLEGGRLRWGLALGTTGCKRLVRGGGARSRCTITSAAWGTQLSGDARTSWRHKQRQEAPQPQSWRRVPRGRWLGPHVDLETLPCRLKGRGAVRSGTLSTTASQGRSLRRRPSQGRGQLDWTRHPQGAREVKIPTPYRDQACWKALAPRGHSWAVRWESHDPPRANNTCVDAGLVRPTAAGVL
jgi:hypothetical protein